MRQEHMPHSITCKNCKATLDTQNMKEFLVCPYCESSYSVSDILNESDAVRSERIRAQTAREIETARMKDAVERERRDEEKTSVEKFKKGKFSKLLVICTVVCGILAAFELSDSFSFAGLIAATQAVLFLAATLMGRGIIPQKKKNQHVLLAAIALILFVPFVMFFGDNTQKNEKADTSPAYVQENPAISDSVSATDNSDSAVNGKATEKATETEEPTESEEPTADTEPTEEITQATNELRSDFKEAMDRYEAFMEEYCDFMEKYFASGGTDLTLLQEYAEYYAKYTEMLAEFVQWEGSDLNDAELDYYFEVQGRVTEKLAKIGY